MFIRRLAFLNVNLKWSCCGFLPTERLNGGSFSVGKLGEGSGVLVSVAFLLPLISVLGRFLVRLFVLTGHGLITGRGEEGFNQSYIVTPYPLVCG